LQRDVKDLAQVGNEAAFLRFLKASAARTGQMLNLSDLARDADVAVNTAKAWLSVLQASFQVLLLPPYHTNLSKRLVKAPKLFFFDTGLCAYLTEWSSPETLEAGAMSGPMLETYVVVEILKSWWNRGKQPNAYFYRDKDGAEIDLLLAQDGKLYPVEVKKSAGPKPEWGRPFSALDRLKPGGSEGAVVCLTGEWLPISKTISAVPLGLL
jgi:predicted AAA+ superfamily ATPase